MADTVQYRLERMVDELDDLEKGGIFTKQEIAEIVKKRRKFEYRLKRPSPLKQDFLAYIDYETQLDSLRRLRKKAVSRELKKKGNKKLKMSVSDYTGVTRIVEIYRLACMRFKGDVELWFKYLEFCRERRNGRMKKVLAQLVRFHPKVPGVWIYAAAWEFDHNLNVASARSLMQSGLRVCPHSEDLWIEYLRMELTYLNKLKARKIALGEVKENHVLDQGGDDKQWRDENKDLFMSIDEGKESKDGQDVDDEDEESKKKLEVFREQGLRILKTIYGGAIEALPSSLSLRKRLLEIMEATDLVQSEDIRKEILTDMKRDFSQDPEYWDWLARREIVDSGSMRQSDGDGIATQLQKAIQVYEDAIVNVSSPTMFKLFLKFLLEVSASEGEHQLTVADGHSENCISVALRAFEKAEAVGCLTEDLACDYVSFYLQLERLDEARKLAEKLTSGKLADSVKLLHLRGSIEIRAFTRDTRSPSDLDFRSIFGLLKRVLTKVSISESESLWLMALKFLATEKGYFEKLVELAFTSAAKERGSESGFSLLSTIVNLALQMDGIKHSRHIYKRFLTLPHPDLAFFRTCIELEQNLASVGNKDCLANARKLYESALTTYDQNLHLWRDYYQMEIKLGTTDTATAVYWRARKTLKNLAAHFDASDLL